MQDLQAYATSLASRARQASAVLMGTSGSTRIEALRRIASGLRSASPELLRANHMDIEAAEQAGLARPLVERLRLSEKRITAVADGVEKIATQVDPVGQTIEGYVRPNGLRVEKRRVPLGVVFFLYESRPNVTADAAALCIWSGNAVILRGGKEAIHSNTAIARTIASGLESTGLPGAAVQLIESTDRSLVPLMLKMDREIDLVIPRGGESLIRAVVAESTIPVLKHFTGNCHIYIDRHVAGLEAQCVSVCVNAKTSYPGGAVCNAVEHILIHRDAVPSVLKPVCEALAAAGVEIRGDESVRSAVAGLVPADESDWGTEYLSLIVGIRIVDSLDEAIDHINRFGSHHTDAILTTDGSAAARFVTFVDSASVLVNASTRLADGGEYGLGAEIGISTDKLHARGPMGATDLCTYKWVVTGAGHLR